MHLVVISPATSIIAVIVVNIVIIAIDNARRSRQEIRQDEALRAAARVLREEIESCLECDYGDGSRGSVTTGEPCDHCEDVRNALRLVVGSMS